MEMLVGRMNRVVSEGADMLGYLAFSVLGKCSWNALRKVSLRHAMMMAVSKQSSWLQFASRLQSDLLVFRKRLVYPQQPCSQVLA